MSDLMTGRVSVLTPSFNQAAYLPANLASVSSQGPLVLEHLVMDGGSQDGSVEVLGAAAKDDPRLRFTSAPDRGQSDAVNNALSQARGDIIGWLNSDDIYYPGAIARAVALLDQDPGLGAVFGHCHKIDAQGRIIGRVDARQVTLEDMLAFGTIPQPSCFLRRQVFIDAGGVDLRYRYAMDYDLWLRLGLRGVRWRAIDETWAGFRLHQTSKSASETPRFLPEVEQAMEEALASPLLPQALRGRRAALRRRFHTAVALAAYANLDLDASRRHVRRAVRAEALGADGQLLYTFAKSLLGPRLVLASRRLKQALRS